MQAERCWDMKLEDMTPKQIEEARKCRSREEFLEFVKREGIELDDDEFESIAGGVIPLGARNIISHL